MLGPSLNRGDSGISKESSTETEQDLGTNNTSDLALVVTTSESDQETESDGKGAGTKDDECFESSDLHDNETETDTGEGRGEGEDVADSSGGFDRLAERDDQAGVEEGTLDGPSWIVSIR
jgi:hypothetical protein